MRVPITPGAALFDLDPRRRQNLGRRSPYGDLGYAAATNAEADFALGTAGAGYGAWTYDLQGGLGSASAMTSRGFVVGALAAVNPAGRVTRGSSPHFWAASYERGAEFGGLGAGVSPRRRVHASALERRARPTRRWSSSRPTRAFSKAQMTRIAIMASAGFALAMRPAFGPADGDVVFAASTARAKRDADAARSHGDRNARRRMRRARDRARHLRGEVAAVPRREAELEGQIRPGPRLSQSPTSNSLSIGTPSAVTMRLVSDAMPTWRRVRDIRPPTCPSRARPRCGSGCNSRSRGRRTPRYRSSLSSSDRERRVPSRTFRLSQVRFSVTGSCASARQKLLMKSLFRTARMSANTAAASGESSASLSNLTVAISSLRFKEPFDAERRGVDERRFARHHLREQPAADRAERQAEMLMAEIEPQTLVARRRADHRQHVGQAGPPAEPGLRLEPLGEREQFAREAAPARSSWRGRRRVVAAREFRAGRQAQAARHRRDDIALLEIEHRAR